MDNPSIMSHVSIGVADVERSAAFYDAVLAVLGARRMFDYPGAVAYGRVFPEFWINRPYDGGAPGVGNGTHIAFLARSREEVDAFWAAGLTHGGTGEDGPGARPDNDPGYYACFLRDPDGHKIEAHVIEGSGDGESEVEAHPT